MSWYSLGTFQTGVWVPWGGRLSDITIYIQAACISKQPATWPFLRQQDDAEPQSQARDAAIPWDNNPFFDGSLDDIGYFMCHLLYPIISYIHMVFMLRKEENHGYNPLVESVMAVSPWEVGTSPWVLHMAPTQAKVSKAWVKASVVTIFMYLCVYIGGNYQSG